MSCLEIAELTDKRHDNAMRTIDPGQKGVLAVRRLRTRAEPIEGYRLGNRDSLDDPGAPCL